jgi:ornithine cyclodeaminase/alanine dehydrogenase-like protein (mu-crystallin family)
VSPSRSSASSFIWHSAETSRARFSTVVSPGTTWRSWAGCSWARSRGRRNADEITVFDSTGLAVQDLAVALAVYERWLANLDSTDFVEVTEIEL